MPPVREIDAPVRLRGMEGPVRGTDCPCNCRTCLSLHPKIRNENSGQRGSFGPDIPADIRPKTSVRPSKSWKNKHFRTDIPARTSMKKLRSEKLRADFSLPKKSILKYFRNQIIADPKTCLQEFISGKLLILLRDKPCLELVIVSSNFQALLGLQDNY